MQVSRQSPIIVSEHKRTSFDQNGAVDKCEVVRCIRKKQASPSFLPNSSDESGQQQNSKSQSFREILEYLMWMVVVLCIVALILKMSGLSLSMTIEQTDQQTLSQSQLDKGQSNFREAQFGGKQELSYSRFIKQLKDQSKESTENMQFLKLNSFKQNFDEKSPEAWYSFVDEMMEGMECGLDKKKGKMVCQKRVFSQK